MSLPEKIGRYQIESEIGRGGMAVVYLALDPTMNRKVAIKILPRQFSFDPSFQERFRREVEIIASLEHPAIVPVYDFGVFDQQPFLVMRYMPGGSLGSRLREGPFSPAQASTILHPIAAAIDKAHNRNIIHRDIKPDNVLFDDDRQPYLSDFGIARLAEGTQTMTIIGTPSYMSPEQAQGDLQIDGRSDIYSLGVMLFEMLSGQSPYQADTAVRLMMKHVLEPIPNILAFNPDLPSEFQSVIDRAMAKDPSDRFTSATEMANAISAIMSGNKIPAAYPLAATVVDTSPTGTTENQVQGNLIKEKRSLMGLTVLIAVLILIVAAGFIWNLFGSGQGRSQNGTPVADAAHPKSTTLTVNTIQTKSDSFSATQSALPTLTPNLPLSTSSPTEPLFTDTPTPTARPSSTPTPISVVDLTSYALGSASDTAGPSEDLCGTEFEYGWRNLVDGDEETAWRVDGNGIGAFIVFDFEREITLTSLKIIPGYNKTDPCPPHPDRCRENHIPSKIRLTISNRKAIDWDLTNDCTWQHKEIEPPLQTSSIKLSIEDSHSRRDDHPNERTAISEIQFYGSR